MPVLNALKIQMSALSGGGCYLHEREQSLTVGLSCLLYALPGILCLFLSSNVRMYTSILEGFIYLIVAISSFLSDYYFIAKDGKYQFFDRWIATVSTITTIVKGLSIVRTGYLADIYLPYLLSESSNSMFITRTLYFIILVSVSLGCIALSRHVKNQHYWIIWHSLWHLVSACGMCWAVFVECNDYAYFNIIDEFDGSPLHVDRTNMLSNNWNNIMLMSDSACYQDWDEWMPASYSFFDAKIEL